MRTCLRDQPPVINTVPGAIEIQQLFENTEWVSQSGTPVAYAPHFQHQPLDGVPAKSVIIQFAKGDKSLPNPLTTAMLRAGDLKEYEAAERSPHGPSSPGGLFLHRCAGNGPAMHAGVPALEQ